MKRNVTATIDIPFNIRAKIGTTRKSLQNAIWKELCEIISDYVVSMVPVIRGKIKCGKHKLHGWLKTLGIDCRRL